MGRVAILVVSYNYPELTNSLCQGIVERTKGVDYDLYVLENGSGLDNVSDYMTLWVKDGVRMTRGFNLLKTHADLTAMTKGHQYDAYHLFVNDAKFIDEQDLVSVMYNEMMLIPDCGQINPYQQNIGYPHLRQNKMNASGARKESFSEIICPMIRAKTWQEIPDLLDNEFFYGWGLDYDIPYRLHTSASKWRLYITDTVGIYHQAFTSYREKEKTREKLHLQEFVGKARENMNAGFEKKYGADWKRLIHDSIPEDVNYEALFLWLHVNDGFQP
jgi:hypothetical protein